MRQPNDDSAGKRPARKPAATRTVRFTAVVASAGQPEVYLPLFDPKQDRAFMRAVKEQRVLSVRQEPASHRTDFGVVGFDEQKHTTYLVFPKSLRAFAGAHVIGIKYDVVSESSVRASAGPRTVKHTKTQRREPSPRENRSAPLRVAKPAPRQPVEKQPRQFQVRVRVTTVAERDLTVKAVTKAEAKKKALESAHTGGAVRVLSIREA